MPLKQVTLLVLLLSCFSATAQRPLSEARRSSIYEYLYELSNEETFNIYKYGNSAINSSYLHTLKDSVLHDGNLHRDPPPGNYLQVYAENNVLKATFTSVNNVMIKNVGNGRDLIILLHDLKGNLIKDADVRIGKHKLHYDATSQSWLLEKYSKPAMLRVTYQGILTCVDLEYSNYRYRSTLGEFLTGLRYSRLFNRRERGYLIQKNRHGSYLVYSKPVYKPGDTVRFKAYLSNKKGMPFGKQLLVRLSDDLHKVDTILTTLSPASPGSYHYQFVLSPEMGLRIDEDYTISLETLQSRKYDLSTYKGELTDDEYTAKRHIYIKDDFKLEDYELHQLTFDARADKTIHHSGEPLTIYLKATDENKLPVMDGKIQILVEQTAISNFYEKDMFVPKKLWEYTGTMDPVGETKIILPDSIYPAADFSYRIVCTFTNSNNEAKRQMLQADYRHNNDRIFFAAHQDSLYITFSGKEQSTVPVWIYGRSNQNDTIDRYHTTLPATIKINPLSSYYTVRGGNSSGIYNVNYTEAEIALQTNWSNDTGSIHVENTFNLPFWYTIIKGRKVVLRGYGNTFDWRAPTKHNQQYDIYVHYIWGGKVRQKRTLLGDPGGELHISTNMPATIYPGQTATIDINVKDKYMRPVANADITSYAYTRKFDNNAPSIPAFALPVKKRKYFRELKIESNSATEGTQLLNMDWNTYGRRMGLYSMLFFRFAHPSPVFTYTQPVKDSITQIAPFVFARGSMQPVHILYVDEVPVYYSMANPVQPYSFQIGAGPHSIKMRTQYQLISFELNAQQGVKSFISIDSAIQDKGFTIAPMPDTLTTIELGSINRYMLQLHNNFGYNHTYIEQGNKYYDVNYISGVPKGRNDELLIGPMNVSLALLNTKDHFTQLFEREPGYVFSIWDGLIKEKQQTTPLHRLYRIPYDDQKMGLSDIALTESIIDSLTRERENEELERIDKSKRIYGDSKNSRLQLDFSEYEGMLKNRIQKFFLFRNNDTFPLYTLSGSMRDFSSINDGRYRLFILLKDNSYILQDSLSIKTGYLHYFRFDTIHILPADKESRRLDDEIRQEVRDASSDNYNLQQQLKSRYLRLKAGMTPYQNVANQRILNVGEISGTVVDQDDEPLIGASVKIRGTHDGVATDENGNFVIKVPIGRSLLISYVGFKTSELRPTEGRRFIIRMSPNDKMMNEVVVTALGINREQKALGYAVSTITSEQIAAAGATNFAEALYGKAAGVKITTAPGSLSAPRHMKLPDPVLPNDNLLPTAAELPQDIPESSLRTNFKDEAFWQPALKTDANGKTSFTLTFPDDITRWNALTIAMSGKRQSGIDQTLIRSFKTLSGTLAIPAFAVEGDTMQILGKTMNYTADSITVSRKFSVDDSLYMTATSGFKNALIDSLLVPVKTNDSIRFEYTVNRNGYMDGEERKIPVVARGTTETTGIFAALNGDTTFSYKAPYNTPVTIYAEAAVLPVLMDEIAKVQNYKYLCNEQLASKLKAFLLEKKIAGFLKQDFKKDKDIRDIIGRLLQGKAGAGWGWWKNAPASPWITKHVMEALMVAKEQRYMVTIDKQSCIDYFTTELNTNKDVDTVSTLELLAAMDAKIDYKSYIDTLIARAGEKGYDTIGITALQQKTGLPINLAPLLETQKQTVFGNAFWGKDTLQMFSNSIEHTLAVYKILRKAGGHDVLLQKMRNYFLEQRKDGHWNNTYQSALILETILPDVMEEATQGTASITINGKQISQFPYTDTLPAGNIQISKQGKLPVYFTAYQRFQNRQPEKVTRLFDVTAVLTDGLLRKEALQAGVPIKLEVTVDAKQTADYVLVEIPIPAGCSYNDKSQVGNWGNRNNEVHREHFKDRVSIFCTKLTAGKHTFTISLLPRYSGHYYLNPAKAEMQYFPVFMGRDGLKQLYIY